jgi:hypothetical protein
MQPSAFQSLADQDSSITPFGELRQLIGGEARPGGILDVGVGPEQVQKRARLSTPQATDLPLAATQHPAQILVITPSGRNGHHHFIPRR